VKKLLIAMTCSTLLFSTATSAKPDADAVVKHYVTLIHSVYSDALMTAKTLETAIHAFLADPSAAHLDATKTAWKAARVPYQQSEVFRFGNAVIDDWEGKVNAWPLDEGMIDYVAVDSYSHEEGNPAALVNIINSAELKIGTDTIDASRITPALLESLHEIGGSEANVATGYHAIEFLLWGQDLNGTGAGAGERPYTDYLTNKKCTSGTGNGVDAEICKRRAAYLKAATELLISDLTFITQQWAPEGEAAQALLATDSTEGMRRLLFGMGSLSLGELAGERMKVALIANSTEDEHDCFSDNTHHSHFYNAQGIKNVYVGTYVTTEGKALSGPSLAEIVAAESPDLHKDMLAAFDKSLMAIGAMVESAEQNNVHFDQLIAVGNAEGKQIVQQAINALVAQTRVIEKVAGAVGVANLSPDTADHTF